MKRLLALFLLLIMLPTFATAGSGQTYEQCLLNLDTYLDPTARWLFGEDGLKTVCNDILSSRCQYYSQFFMYASALYAIEENNYEDANAFLSVLKSDSSFSSHLASATFQTKYPNIGTLEELSLYLQGCQMEYSGNSSMAKAYFMQCIDFYDSIDRLAYTANSTSSNSLGSNIVYDGTQRIGQTIQLKMNNSSAHARSGPGENYDFVAYVYYGDVYTVLDAKPANNGKMWFKIKIGNQYGWITSGLTHTVLPK